MAVCTTGDKCFPKQWITVMPMRGNRRAAQHRYERGGYWEPWVSLPRKQCPILPGRLERKRPIRQGIYHNGEDHRQEAVDAVDVESGWANTWHPDGGSTHGREVLGGRKVTFWWGEAQGAQSPHSAAGLHCSNPANEAPWVRMGA